jgi:CubicO group peptidase (beta-lactamase class C family)
MQKIKIFLLLFFAFIIGFLLLDHFQNGVLPLKTSATAKNSTDDTNAAWNATDWNLNRASNAFFNETLVRSNFNGAILVCRNGKIIFEEYKGLREVMNGIPIDSATAFHLASVSKTFTAMATLKLREMGLLNLDDPVSAYLNGFPFPMITIRNLLAHRSGLPNYVHFVEKLGWDTQKNLTNQDLLEMIIKYAGKISVGRANSYFEYCNTNYALLALIIEKVSKVSFSTFLKEQIFIPLGMNGSFVYDSTMEEAVLPSFKFNNRREPIMFLDEIYGDKNIYSTPRDLMKWDAALGSNVLFSAETLTEAFKGYSYEKKGVRNYGLGWRLVELPSSKKIIYHNGWWHGNNTVFSRFPSDSTCIIVLGNKFNKSIYQARKIAGIFEGYGIQWDEDE